MVMGMKQTLFLDPDRLDSYRNKTSQYNIDIDNLLVLLDKSSNDTQQMALSQQLLDTVRRGLNWVEIEIIEIIATELINYFNAFKNFSVNFDSQLNNTILMSISCMGDSCSNLLENKLLELLLISVEKSDAGFAIKKAQSSVEGNFWKNKSSAPVADLVDSIHSEFKNPLSRALRLFNIISMQLEFKHPYRIGCTRRILQLCREMNKNAGNIVYDKQLAAAVYMHDFSMLLVPKKILNKPQGLLESEINNVRFHPKYASVFLGRLHGWSAAREIVFQHHERYNGRGYPEGVAGSEICDGAKMLAIADSFEAMTQPRIYRESQLSISQAAREIDDQAGILYDPKWVMHFNTAIEKLYVSRNTSRYGFC